MTNLWIYVGIGLTLATWSFLWKEGPISRWAERTYIGAAVGHSVIVGIYALRDRYYPITHGQPLMIIPALIGYLYLFVLWRKSRWVASYPISIAMGVGLATQLRGAIASDFIGQILGIIYEGGRILGASPTTAFSNIIRIVITLCAITYFIFTVKREGPLGRVNKIGQYFLMAALGAMAGNYLLGTCLSVTMATILRIVFGLLGLG